jgi:glucuronoarabinoxylan endo-1,4-beta-xylanase
MYPFVLDAQSIVIDAGTEYQTIDGFGGMNHTSWVQDLNEDHRTKAFSNDPGYMGLSILRVHIDPSPHRFPEQLPTARYATSQGAKVFASPWDPPSGLIDHSSGEPVLPYENYGAYVGHLNRFNELMSDSGVPLYAISIQNEPDIGEWTSWSPSGILTFAREFAGEIQTRVLAAESFNFNRNYTNPILNDSAASANVDIIGGHIYGNGLYDYPLAREKGKQVWMTEHLTGSDAPDLNNWNLALSMGREINDCMEANFSAYIWWYIRRFYSLIRDDGNISEKGYVMMHYSKFVRPGAVRVDASVTDAQGIQATAYTTDTSLTVVVHNRNWESKEITLDVGNSGFSDYVQFTSKKNSYMVNRGSFSAPDGTFSVSLEASSITTFTTSPGAGGRYNNLPPVPHAGEDLTIALEPGQTQVDITLNGSESSDPDGQIVNYSWAANGNQLSYSVTHDLTVSEGENSYVLTVMDNDGTRRSDTIVIRVVNSYTTDLWIEPECSDVGSNWEKVMNSRASNRYYVRGSPGSELIDAPSDAAEDLIRISFTVTEEGAYKIWGRLVTSGMDANSFWVKMDTLEWTLWEEIPVGSDWYWDDVHAGDNSSPMVYELDSGEHMLQICYREYGALLDKILITNRGITPIGIGGASEGCSVVGLGPDWEEGELRIYPNPSGGSFHVDWEQAFSRLEVFTLDGKTVLTRTYTSPRFSEEVNIRLAAGLYLLRVSNNLYLRYSRLLIE